MSIINEALKKVQNELKSKESGTSTPEEATPSTILAASRIPPAEAPKAPPISDIQVALKKEPEVEEPPVVVQAVKDIPPPPPKPQAAPSITISLPKMFNKPKAAPRPKQALPPEQLRKERLLTAISAFICAALIVCIAVLLHQFIKIHAPKGTINGIMAQNGKNVVLIDNEIYEVGDTYSGARIVAISIDQVQFLENGIIRSVKVKNKNARLKK